MSKKAPTEGVESRMYPRNLFVYSSYFRTWSRVLQFRQSSGTLQVEVDIQPENGRGVNIRRHFTERAADDVYSRYLPYEVYNNLVLDLGQILADKIVHMDLLPLIDWDLYARRTNGGAEFEDIRRRA